MVPLLPRDHARGGTGAVAMAQVTAPLRTLAGRGDGVIAVAVGCRGSRDRGGVAESQGRAAATAFASPFCHRRRRVLPVLECHRGMALSMP